jgi:hypothetical protein
MSGIARRTIFVDLKSPLGILWHDWASVTTGIGTMVEPRCMYGLRATGGGVSATGTAMNPTDDIFRVDAIEYLPIGVEKIKLSDDSIALHGGQLWQRVGY